MGIFDYCGVCVLLFDLLLDVDIGVVEVYL